MKILFIASECTPIAKVGGLADVVGSLPKALKKLGVDVSVAIPYYQSINFTEKNMPVGKDFSVVFDGKEEHFELWQTYLPPCKSDSGECVPLYLIKNDDIFGETIYLEKDASPSGSEKETTRFLFLSAASLKVTEALDIDVLHCHDWHTAMSTFLDKEKKCKFKTVLTIHNLEYQGVYDKNLVNQLLGTDFVGNVNCLETGILNADFITTVSPNYAKEILTKEFGAGLEESLKKRSGSFEGILNGIDVKKFDPKSDSALKKNYFIENLEDKAENKAFLQNRCFGKSDPQIPVLGIVSRLADQKGFDLIIEFFDSLIKENLQIALLGQGAGDYEKFFREMAKKFPQKVFAKIGFDSELAQQIYGGADMFLMPSRFEPCGLGQMIAMRYGTVPIARAVGGIKDTVENVMVKNGQAQGTGFLFDKYDAQEFFGAIKRATDAFKDKEVWKQIQINGMNQDFSWEKSAKIYLSLYEKLIK